MAKKIQILGAGLSGMIAAIDLSRHDYEVTILEGAPGIGGLGNFHPSTHGTPIDGPAAWKYIGLDLSSCFVPPKAFRCYLGKRGFDLDPEGLFLVERGPRESSIDHLLYREAQKVGVKFEFSQVIRKHRDLPPGSIIATGLFPELYEELGVPKLQAFGWATRMEMQRPPELVAYFDNYIGDYYYSAVVNGIFFGMLFQRSPVPREIMERCRDFLREREGLESPDWFYATNYVPVIDPDNPRLFAGDKILAGTIAGMMDPVFLFGINGAVLSGRIAARAVYERDEAIKDFKHYTRNFRLNHRARKWGEKMPPQLRMLWGRLFLALPEFIRRALVPTSKIGIPGIKEFPSCRVIKKI